MNDLVEKIGELTSVITRLDERLNGFIDKLNKLDDKLNDHIMNCPAKTALAALATKVGILETRNGSALKIEIKDELKEIKAEIKLINSEVNLLKSNTKDLAWLTSSSNAKWQGLYKIIYLCTP